MGIRIGSMVIRIGSVRLFKYQHVGIDGGFALQWHIGFSLGEYRFLSTAFKKGDICLYMKVTCYYYSKKLHLTGEVQ